VEKEREEETEWK